MALCAPVLRPRPLRAASSRTVRLTLPWVAEGSDAVAFVAKANGYWSEAGLDVQISRGYGSITAAQAVAAGRFDFGLVAAASAIQQTAAGLPLVSLACNGYDSTMSVAVLEDSPIRAPKDLAGRMLGSTITSGEYPFLPAFAHATGLDLARVRQLQLDPNLRQRVLMLKQVDAISGFAISIAPVLAASGMRPRFMLYSRWGLRFYGNVLATRPELAKVDPRTCSAMADGLARAIRFCLLQPADALNLFLREVPEAALAVNGAEQARIGLGLFNLTTIAPLARQQGVGMAALDDYRAMTDLVMRYAAGAGARAPEPSSLFTNEFVGRVRLTEAEWGRAEDQVKEYRDYFS